MILKKGKIQELFQNQKSMFTDIVVIINNDCNAKCELCIAKQVIKNKTCKELCAVFDSKCKRCCDRTASDESFFQAIEEIFSVVKGQNVRAFISGGEPTLSKRLIPIVKCLGQSNFGGIGIETNGAQLLDEGISNALIENHVQILLSRYAVEDSKNDKIFKFTNFRITNTEIKRILKMYKGVVTMNCIPLKNGVETAKELLRYYIYYLELGAKDVQFTEAMFDTTLSKSNGGISAYYAENRIRIDDLSKDLEEVGVPLSSKSGDAFRIMRHRYHDKLISLSSADMSKIAYQNQNDKMYSKFIIYPSGEVGTHSIEIR